MPRELLVVVLLCILTILGFVTLVLAEDQRGQGVGSWKFLPFDERSFPPFIADPLETHSGFFLFSGRKAQGNIGYQLAIVDYT